MEYQHLQQKHLKEKISAPFMTRDDRTFFDFFFKKSRWITASNFVKQGLTRWSFCWADDAIVMKILHDDSIFNIFMLSGAISRGEMNAVLKKNGIPLKVSTEVYEELIKHWIYKVLQSCI